MNICSLQGVLMVRPKKCRFVRNMPKTLFYKPRAIPMADLELVKLNVEELEAIRLKDKRNLNQEECAKKMEVSRTTFHRIYKSAKEKIADFLVNGKALKIEGGMFVTNLRVFKCNECSHTWKRKHGKGRPMKCPKCESNDIESMHKIKTSDNN